MEVFIAFLKKHTHYIKRISFFTQVATLFFMLLTYMHSSLLGSLFTNQKDFTNTLNTLQSCLILVLILSIISLFLATAIFIINPRKWNYFHKLAFFISALISFILALILLGNVASLQAKIASPNLYVHLSTKNITDYNSLLLLNLALLWLSSTSLLNYNRNQKEVLVTKESTITYFKELIARIKLLPKKIQASFKLHYTNFKETVEYHKNYYKQQEKKDYIAIWKKNLHTCIKIISICIQHIFKWILACFQTFFRWLASCIQFIAKKLKPLSATEIITNNEGNSKKRIKELSPEIEEKINRSFRKPLLLKKRILIPVLIYFCFQSFNSYQILVDLSKETIDVFQNMTLHYHGISGEGYARIETLPSSTNPELNEFLSTFHFRIEANRDLKNGDIVTVVAASYDKEMMERYNYKIEFLEKEFYIARMDTIPTSLDNVIGAETIIDSMTQFMRSRQAYMTWYSYVPVIECYAPDPQDTTHYTYFIETKYGVLLRVYDVREAYTKYRTTFNYHYAYLLIYDHISVNQINQLSDVQRFIGIKIGEINYYDYMQELQENNGFRCVYLID